MSNINDKNSPDQMRVMMKRMREGAPTILVNETTAPVKELSMRDMLKMTRDVQDGKVSLNEDVENKQTVYDQSEEEEKFKNFFNDMNVSIKFIDLGVYNNLIFWGGTIDGVIQFVYKVTPDEITSGVEFNYLNDFNPDNPENEEIIGRIESYFDNFYKYWRDNVLEDEEVPEEEEEPKELQLDPQDDPVQGDDDSVQGDDVNDDDSTQV